MASVTGLSPVFGYVLGAVDFIWGPSPVSCASEYRTQ